MVAGTFAIVSRKGDDEALDRWKGGSETYQLVGVLPRRSSQPVTVGSKASTTWYMVDVDLLGDIPLVDGPADTALSVT